MGRSGNLLTVRGETPRSAENGLRSTVNGAAPG